MSGTFAERSGPEAGIAQSALTGLARFFSSALFPLAVLSLIAAFEAWLVLMLVLPAADSGLGAFANEFRIWCFGYDPATGKLDWAYTIMLFADPLGLAAVVAAIWREPLVGGLRRNRPLAAGILAASFALIAVLTAGLLWRRQPSEPRDLPFPADTLRTAFAAPALDLQNQDGDRVTLDSLRGKVVVVTGVYTSCVHTCPILMGQAKNALAALTPAERSEVRVLAITLNPEYDTQEVLLAAAERYQVRLPEFQFLTGEPATVNGTLDALQIARTKNMQTGAIDHSNLFVVIDKRGRVAYRLTIGDRQERWLISALRGLSREPAGPGA